MQSKSLLVFYGHHVFHFSGDEVKLLKFFARMLDLSILLVAISEFLAKVFFQRDQCHVLIGI